LQEVDITNFSGPTFKPTRGDPIADAMMQMQQQQGMGGAGGAGDDPIARMMYVERLIESISSGWQLQLCEGSAMLTF
jgi:hypothetical protein